ncbi:alpha/beta hydrolase [Rahnella bonaserana]|uniref:alpha/beta fold hydrolase n=1 Tax=Rahnella bonaserana TaxID=2816248 RepID=UPI0032097496
MSEEEYRDFRRAIHSPATVDTMLEDYRAGLSIDRLHEEEDRQRGRKIQCPVLCLWSEKDDLGQIYRDIPSIWQNWASNVHTGTIKSGHHMAEEAPHELCERLKDFLMK